MSLTFYTTLGCHLCDLAQNEMGAVYSQLPAIEVVDIALDNALVERYGTRIPVLYHKNTGAELNWPFTADEIIAWLNEQV